MSLPLPSAAADLREQSANLVTAARAATATAERIRHRTDRLLASLAVEPQAGEPSAMPASELLAADSDTESDTWAADLDGEAEAAAAEAAPQLRALLDLRADLRERVALAGTLPDAVLDRFDEMRGELDDAIAELPAATLGEAIDKLEAYADTLPPGDDDLPEMRVFASARRDFDRLVAAQEADESDARLFDGAPAAGDTLLLQVFAMWRSARRREIALHNELHPAWERARAASPFPAVLTFRAPSDRALGDPSRFITRKGGRPTWTFNDAEDLRVALTAGRLCGPLQLRAEEIVVAWDAWRTAHEASELSKRYRQAAAEASEATNAQRRLRDSVLLTPATGMAGLLAKALIVVDDGRSASDRAVRHRNGEDAFLAMLRDVLVWGGIERGDEDVDVDEVDAGDDHGGDGAQAGAPDAPGAIGPVDDLWIGPAEHVPAAANAARPAGGVPASGAWSAPGDAAGR